MMTAGQLAETFERIRLGEHTPEDWVGLEDHIATLTLQLAEARKALEKATALYENEHNARTCGQSFEQWDYWAMEGHPTSHGVYREYRKTLSCLTSDHAGKLT